MAVQRRFQAGAESNTTASDVGGNEFTADGASLTVQATPKTGAYAFRIIAASTGTANVYGDAAIPATRQFRISGHFNLPIFAGSSETILFWKDAAGNDLGSLRMYGGGTDLNLGIYNAAGVAQATAANVYSEGVYCHIGVDVKIDSSAGWVKVYKDRAEILSWTGNTGNADAVLVRFGGQATGSIATATGHAYCDDLYIDDTTGEAAADVVPDRRFEYITPNGNGNYSQCLGSDGNSVSNYLLVDERPHTSDTDYVEADTLDERDTYAMTTVTIPGGWAMIALIACAYVKKTNGAVDTQVALTLRESATDADGSAQAPGTSYGLKSERFTSKPSGGAWDQSALDGVEVGHIGKGTF